MPLFPTRALPLKLCHATLLALQTHRNFPPSDLAGRKLPVRRQQAAHSLRVGGHPGLRLCWLWLELGSGKLRVREDRLECCSSEFENHNNGSTSKCTVRVLGEERESERHFYHAPTSLIAANKRDYLPDACFYRGTESGRLQTRNQTSTSGERPLLPPWRFS